MIAIATTTSQTAAAGSKSSPDGALPSISGPTCSALSTLLENSAQRLVDRAAVPDDHTAPDDHIVRDTKRFVDCVAKIERTNATVRAQPGGSDAPGPHQADFLQITKPTRGHLSVLLERVAVAVAKRSLDPSDEHIMRDTKVIIDCVLKVEQLNLARQGQLSRPSGSPKADSRGRSAEELARQVVAAGEKYSAQLRQQELQRQELQRNGQSEAEKAVQAALDQASRPFPAAEAPARTGRPRSRKDRARRARA